MELHFKYLEAVQQADKRIEGEKHVSMALFFPFTLSSCPLHSLIFVVFFYALHIMKLSGLMVVISTMHSCFQYYMIGHKLKAIKKIVS